MNKPSLQQLTVATPVSRAIRKTFTPKMDLTVDYSAIEKRLQDGSQPTTEE